MSALDTIDIKLDNIRNLHPQIPIWPNLGLPAFVIAAIDHMPGFIP